jgi:hypothetical protein
MQRSWREISPQSRGSGCRLRHDRRVSVSVPLDQLATAVAQRAFAYVVTVSGEGSAHLLAVQVVADGDDLVMDVGRRTSSNVTERAEVTLVFPPIGAHEREADAGEPGEHDAYSLVVDGSGSETAGRLRVRPTGAVMHRPAPPFSR